MFQEIKNIINHTTSAITENDVAQGVVDSLLVLSGGAAIVSEEVMHKDFMGLEGWSKVLFYLILGLTGLFRMKVLWHEGEVKRQEAKIKAANFEKLKELTELNNQDGADQVARLKRIQEELNQLDNRDV